MDTSTINHISLCSGYGGIDLGLSRAMGGSLRTIAYSEIEAFAAANLVAKMEAGLLDPAPIWSDLKSFPWQEFRGLVDIVSGGYPCQPFSAAGKRAGKDDPRHLWPWIADGIAICKPRLCFFENVEGHISLGLSTVISDLEEMGYRTTWGVFSAAEVGAPHQRKRVFILAHCAGLRSEVGHIAGSQGTRKAGDVVSCSPHVWPSRPSEPQHGWEPPRVVGNERRSVDNASGNGHRAHDSVSAGRQSAVDASGLAHADGFRMSGSGDQLGITRQEGQGGTHTASHCNPIAWPSRLGEPQHGWEPPRVVVDAKGERAARRQQFCGEECGSRRALPREPNQPDKSLDHTTKPRQQAQRDESVTQRREGSAGESGQRQTQPSLGGNPHGSAHRLDHAELYVTSDNRTDELRLLGNGVVPATAERAFLTLLSELAS